MSEAKKPRPFETRYYGNVLHVNPRYAISRGFPKGEEGSIKGAAKAVAQGYVHKVQCIDRTTNEPIWTVLRGNKVRGVNIYPVLVFKHDVDEKKPNGRDERKAAE